MDAGAAAAAAAGAASARAFLAGGGEMKSSMSSPTSFLSKRADTTCLAGGFLGVVTFFGGTLALPAPLVADAFNRPDSLRGLGLCDFGAGSIAMPSSTPKREPSVGCFVGVFTGVECLLPLPLRSEIELRTDTETLLLR